jgi:hypothetical protein
MGDGWVVDEPGDRGDVEMVVGVTPEVAASDERHASLISAMAGLGIRFGSAASPAPPVLLPGNYHVALVAGDLANRAIEQVRKLDGVAAAYIKTRGEAP